MAQNFGEFSLDLVDIDGLDFLVEGIGYISGTEITSIELTMSRVNRWEDEEEVEVDMSEKEIIGILYDKIEAEVYASAYSSLPSNHTIYG